MGKYFLGIDGGGTKTTATLADEKANIVISIVGDSINYYSEGLEGARNNFKNILEEISKKTNISDLHSIFIGSSALFEKASDEELESFTRGISQANFINMDSDLAIALEGMMHEGECAVVISGTGSMVVGRKADDSIICRGGYGYILGDEGSGYKIGLTGIQKGITAFEGASPKTRLTEALQKKYAVEDLHDLIDIFYNPPIERKVIANFAKEVLLLARQGDEVAYSIVDKEAKKLAATTAALLREFQRPVPLGVFGGIFMHHRVYFDSFCGELNRLIPTADIFKLPITPDRGAILAAMKAAGIKITDEIKENIKKQTGGNYDISKTTKHSSLTKNLIKK